MLRLVAVIAVLGAGTPASALHRVTPDILAVTTTAEGENVNPAGQGTKAKYAVFESTADPLGIGSTGRHVFFFSNHPPRSVQQITTGTGDSANPRLDGRAFTVVFDSDAPLGGPPASARQIVRWTASTGAFQRLTDGDQDSVRPATDKRGAAVVFESDADLLGNGATGRQIFLWRASPACDVEGCGNLIQVTDAPGTSSHASFGTGGNGRTVVFQSDAPLVGPSNGFRQIFLYDRRTATLRQVTSGAGDSIAPAMDRRGQTVAFQSQADLLGNGSSGWEIFLFNSRRGELTQLTNGDGDSTAPALTLNARLVAYLSTTGGSAPGPHVFVWDVRAGHLHQVTAGVTGSSGPPNAAGRSIFLFSSTEDPLWQGLSTPQVYAVNLYYEVHEY